MFSVVIAETAPAGGQQVECHVERLRPFRHRAMEGVHVDVVASPRNVFAGGVHLEPGQIGDRSRRAVRSGNPLGVVERDLARLDGNHQMRVINLLRRLAGVEFEQHRAARFSRPNLGTGRPNPNRKNRDAGDQTSHRWGTPEGQTGCDDFRAIRSRSGRFSIRDAARDQFIASCRSR